MGKKRESKRIRRQVDAARFVQEAQRAMDGLAATRPDTVANDLIFQNVHGIRTISETPQESRNEPE